MGNTPNAVSSGDFDGDGDHDLCVTSGSLGTTLIFNNLGDAEFTPPYAFPVQSFPTDIVVADFDNNGSPDFAVANELSGSVTVYLNELPGGPEPFELIAPANGAGELALPEHARPWSDGAGRLTWESARGFTTTYRVVVGTTPSLVAPIATFEDVENAFLDVPDGLLQELTEYYWNVEAVGVDGSGLSLNGPFSFTTSCAKGVPSPDLNGDGAVDSLDLAALLSRWGF